MNSELSLFSLKFKNYGIRENLFKYILITLSIVLVVTVEYLSVPIIIMSYILLSMFNKEYEYKVKKLFFLFNSKSFPR